MSFISDESRQQYNEKVQNYAQFRPAIESKIANVANEIRRIANAKRAVEPQVEFVHVSMDFDHDNANAVYEFQTNEAEYRRDIEGHIESELGLRHGQDFTMPKEHSDSYVSMGEYSGELSGTIYFNVYFTPPLT